MSANSCRLPEIILQNEKDLLEDWVREQLAAINMRADLISESNLRTESTEFLKLLKGAIQTGSLTNIDGPEWDQERSFLAEVSRSRARRGFSPSEAATFVLSFKQPLFARLRREIADAQSLSDEIGTATVLLDKLGLYSFDAYVRTREEIISRQQVELLELSTPVVQLWAGVLALPLIGTLDSARTQVVMENLLQKILETGAAIAIIDITGVPTVDTLVAQHLLKTVASARLMGADCIISGIRPQIAQTIVHLGVELGDVTTKAKLADAFAVALQRLGLAVTKSQARS